MKSQLLFALLLATSSALSLEGISRRKALVSCLSVPFLAVCAPAEEVIAAPATAITAPADIKSKQILATPEPLGKSTSVTNSTITTTATKTSSSSSLSSPSSSASSSSTTTNTATGNTAERPIPVVNKGDTVKVITGQYEDQVSIALDTTEKMVYIDVYKGTQNEKQVRVMKTSVNVVKLAK